MNMHPLPPPNRGQSSSTAQSHDHGHVPTPAHSSSQKPTSSFSQQARNSETADSAISGKKKRKHRGGKKRKNRRQSFAAPSETSAMQSVADGGPDDPLMEVPGDEGDVRGDFYRRPTNLSDESLESEALLDHRDQSSMRPRRESRVTPFNPSSFRAGALSNPFTKQESQTRRGLRTKQSRGSDYDSDDGNQANDRTPLISGHEYHRTGNERHGLFRKKSTNSTNSSKSRPQRKRDYGIGQFFPDFDQEYHVNNPPSVPGSPSLAAQYDDVMVNTGDFLTRSPDSRRNLQTINKDALIDIDTVNNKNENSNSSSPRLRADALKRHRALSLPAEGDVCFPGDEVSVLAEEDFVHSNLNEPDHVGSRRRNRRRNWPQLWVLDEWSREEKEARAGERGVKKINEPVFVEGRLRPSKNPWHRIEEDVPYRYTYFNEEFESTIHAQTISELVQTGSSFQELFIPDPPELSESTDSDEEEENNQKSEDTGDLRSPKSQLGPETASRGMSRVNSLVSDVANGGPREYSGKTSDRNSEKATPQKPEMSAKPPKPKKYGPRPTFWLDVMCPTDQEMRVLCKAFGIHALTSEDIMMQEAREKVELFRHYYFINYRTFEQDTNDEDYLDAINMYVCVFRHGIITFHFSQIPHPANVRRRIRQLTDYLILTADWISYAIIDDITDVYQPLITNIEHEVDDIDDLILRAFQNTNELAAPITGNDNEKQSDAGDSGPSGIDMLRRIGECRKKVMSLYRLLGNKADVIKGFAKRCTEQWEVAPKSEIGLYLGDIQDHILTMTSNLSHYETLLSRAHSNYLAQVSIRMNERQEQTADVLGKLTVVGTIVLPMNIICGMWGMNVKVPGQEVDNLIWFWCITAGLIMFAVICFFWAKRVYGIV